MSGRQTSIQASNSGSNTESTQVGIELATSSMIAQPTQSDDPHEDSDSDSASGSENESELSTTTAADVEESQELLLKSNQPRLKSFPSKQFGKNKVEYRSFNSKWFDNEKWTVILSTPSYKDLHPEHYEPRKAESSNDSTHSQRHRN